MAGNKFFPVILAGGSGTRFWPASRGGTPKQCLEIFGDRTLLESTLARIALLGGERTTIVATEELAKAMAKAAANFPHQMLLEPEAKNTAAACALAVHHFADNPDAVLAIFPADHFVGDDQRFQADLRQAIAIAHTSGDLVVLGVTPTMPHTGYGYAEVRGKRADGAMDVHRFHEKPEAHTAAQYLAAGTFFWNAGIFVGTVQAFAREFRDHAPGLWNALAMPDLRAAYASLVATPFDVAVLERSSRRALLPATFPWSDVGTWAAVAEAFRHRGDANGNLTLGAKTPIAFDHANDCVVFTDTLKAVGVVGLKHIVVAEKDGRLLVAAQDASERVRHVASQLDEKAP